MKIRELPSIATTNPNNSVYRVLGSAYEKTSNGFLIKKTRRSKPPPTRVGLAWISPAAAKKVRDPLPPITSSHIFPTCNSKVSLNICAQRWCRMQKREAWLCQLNPFYLNDTAMHNNNLCKFDPDIYVIVKVRQLWLAFGIVKQHADNSSYARDMAIYVKMTFT